MKRDWRLLPASGRAFYTAFERWAPEGPAVNPVRALVTPEELAVKRRRHGAVLEAGLQIARQPVDWSQNWDKAGWATAARIQNAALHYLFTGDRRTLPPAVEGLEALERCDRPYWTFSSCIGVLDMDLLTATNTYALGLMMACMGEALEEGVRRRLIGLLTRRILAPALEAERRRAYAWMKNRANWRIILPGCFAMAAMACADECPDYRELVGFGLEGVLLALGTGDAEGGWNEGPGYWDYGLGYAVLFARQLAAFTGGRVDLFQHPFLRKTGDFRLFMHTRKGEIWNWSDAEKKAPPSLTLLALARAYQNPAYQWLALSQGIPSLGHLLQADPWVKSAAPPAGKPATRLFPGAGVLVWRSGFGPRDSYIGIKAGDIPHFNHHCQMDFGSVVIHAEGRELLAETPKWPYPYEGKKDPGMKGAKPGFYDYENRRWMRWDFDYVAALGHNMLTLEGLYPQPVTKARARLFRTGEGAGHAFAVVDSTAVYRPLASRVRRFVVFLRPDVVLLVDEIRSPRPVRARLHFHPAGPVEKGRDAFVFRNGGARLNGTALYPSASDHLILGLDERTTTYLPPGGLVDRTVRYLYIENLYRKKKLVFVTALQFGKAGFRPAAFAVEGTPATGMAFSVSVTRGGKTVRVRVDPGKGAVSVE